MYFVIDNKAILFFFRLALNAFPAIWSVGRIGKKKITRSLGKGGPGTPG